MDTFIFQLIYFILCCFITFAVGFLMRCKTSTVKYTLEDMKQDRVEFYLIVLILEFSNLTAFFITRGILYD